ncbi:MAG: two-component system sensor histidine kinase NtrB [Longimicrobiales bacterium]
MEPQEISSLGVLRWLYVGRLTLVSGILAAALLSWGNLHPQQSLFATLIFVVAVTLTAMSFWWTHVALRQVSTSFAYAQAILDAGLVTSIVHLTGGVESPLTPLYILVIASGSLALPISGGLLIGALSSGLFVAEAILFQHGQGSAVVALQVTLFGAVAVTVGVLADRLRKGGTAVGELESELRQLRLDTGDILDNIRSGILTVDERGRLVYLNPVGEAMLGLERAPLIGQPVLASLNEVAPGLGDVVRRSIEHRRPVARFRTETSLQPNPTTLGVSTTVLERDSTGPYPVTAIFQDITDVERLEDSNRRNERLQAVAALSASLAHEIKNPLASIQSAVEQLAGGKLAPTDQQVLKKLVVNQSQRLSRLLSEFIDFSGLEIGPRSELDIRALAAESMALVQQHPEAGGVDFKVVGPSDPVMLIGDRDLIHRALFNLILNAAQFSGADGSVQVSVDPSPAPAGLMDEERAGSVRVSISDSGPGVDANDLGRIFDPFYTKRRGGSGLGLAVVQRTVEAHDGSVFVESAPNGGARFVLVLPGLGSGT